MRHTSSVLPDTCRTQVSRNTQTRHLTCAYELAVTRYRRNGHWREEEAIAGRRSRRGRSALFRVTGNAPRPRGRRRARLRGRTRDARRVSKGRRVLPRACGGPPSRGTCGSAGVPLGIVTPWRGRLAGVRPAMRAGVRRREGPPACEKPPAWIANHPRGFPEERSCLWPSIQSAPHVNIRREAPFGVPHSITGSGASLRATSP